MNATGSCLQIEGLCVGGGPQPLLDQVDLSVACRSIHAILGPNGGGKSTLLRTILGQVPFRGEIRVQRSAQPIGYVPQHFEVERSLPITVRDFLVMATRKLPACLASRPSSSARRSLARLSLSHCEGRRLAQLSGGERCRVLLALALALQPDLLLLDEPTAAADATARAIIESVLLEERERGASILWVSHDLESVARVADQVTLLNGRVHFTGPTAHALEPARILAVLGGEHG